METTIKCNDKHLLRTTVNMLEVKGFEQTFDFIAYSDSIGLRITNNTFYLLERGENRQDWDYTLPKDWDKVAALDPELEVRVGQYWKIATRLIRIAERKKDRVWYEYLEQCKPSGIFEIDLDYLYDTCALSNDNEVEEVLIEEAKKRGFPCLEWEGAKHGFKMVNPELNDRLYYSPDQDELKNMSGSVYYQGHWGQPIKETNINGTAVKFIYDADLLNEEEWKATWRIADNWCVTKNKRRINNIQGSYLTKKEAEKIAEALNYD